MEQFVINAQRRETTGKGAARQGRREGTIPAVVYGHGLDAIPLSIDARELAPVLRHHGGTFINLGIAGMDLDKDLAALLREVQRHPVSRQVLSVDFQWISLSEDVTVNVPIHLVGDAVGVTQENGVLEQVMFEMPVSCKPTSMPENISVDVTNLGLGHSLHIADLPELDGVAFLASPEDAVVTIARPITAADLEARITEEGEGLPEGAEAAEGEE